MIDRRFGDEIARRAAVALFRLLGTTTRSPRKHRAASEHGASAPDRRAGRPKRHRAGATASQQPQPPADLAEDSGNPRARRALRRPREPMALGTSPSRFVQPIADLLRVVGVSTRMPSICSRICCRRPLARVPRTGTVSTSPRWPSARSPPGASSARSTSTQRCRALTISAFSLRDSMGRLSSANVLLKRGGSDRYFALSSSTTSTASDRPGWPPGTGRRAPA